MTDKPHDAPETGRVALRLPRASWPEALWFSISLLGVALVAGLRLSSFPRLGFDEGYYLQLAKNLAIYGEYALASPPQELDWFGFASSSPTLVLPIALNFKLWGIGVTQARLVPALYLVGAVTAVYCFMRQLYGWRAALLSVALFAVAGPTSASLYHGGTLISSFSTPWMGRTVLGEIPSLFFILLGAWAWIRSHERESSRWLVGAGLSFGMAFTTKEQFLPPVVVSLALVYAVDRFYYRRLRLRQLAWLFLVCGIPLGLWYGYQLVVLGPERFLYRLDAMRQVSGASTWLFAPGSWAGNLSLFYNNGFFVVGLAGILYALAHGTRRDSGSPGHLFLPVLTVVLLFWFVFLSIGWPRYAYPVLALSNILAAKLLADLIGPLPLAPRRLWRALQAEDARYRLVAVVVAAAIIAYPLQDLVRQVLFGQDRAPQRFAELTESKTEENALIESFEWEIDFLTNRKYHHPPMDVFVRVLSRSQDVSYDPAAYQPDYLIDGPYSKAVLLYPAKWLSECCEKIGSVGPYDLYRFRGTGPQSHVAHPRDGTRFTHVEGGDRWILGTWWTRVVG